MQFKRVRIRDFGPINDLEMEFEANTVYHFVSENDTGKSMVLDALNFLCCNVPGIHVKKYVADGAESFVVEGEDFKGNIIKLVRGEENYYELTRPDGTKERFDKIGGNVPEPIQKIVNVYIDESKKEKFNFRYAQDPILFVNTTAGENYSFFQKALGTDKILESLKAANTEYNKLVKGLDSLEDTIDYEEQKLEELPSLAGLYKELQDYKRVVEANYKELESLRGVLDTYDELDMLMSEVDVPKEILEYDGDIYREQLAKYNKINDVLDTLDKLEKVDEELRVIGDILESYGNMGGDIEKVRLMRELLESDDIEQSIKDMNDLLVISEDVVNLRDKVEINKTVLDTIIEMNKQLDDLKGLLEAESKLEESLKLADKARNDFLIESNYCPVVANSVDQRCPFTGKTIAELTTCSSCSECSKV